MFFLGLRKQVFNRILSILSLHFCNIATIEDYFYTHGMRQKDGAKLLGVNESQFSQIMSGRRPITMKLAKQLHTKMAIDPKLILDYA